MLRAVIHLIHRELLMALRQRADIFNPLWFFLIVITLFPLGIGPEPQLLARIAPGIIWVAALLAAMLSLERLFRDDFSDGALEQMMLMPHPLGVLALAKVIAHWLLTGLPLLLVSPLLAILLSLELKTYLAVVATLALGTPVLSLLGAVGVALTAGLRKGACCSACCCCRSIFRCLSSPRPPSTRRAWDCPMPASSPSWGPCWWGH